MPLAEVTGDAPGFQAAVAVLSPHVTCGHLPAAVLAVGSSQGLAGQAALGTAADVWFDLASLTKVLATGLLALDLVGQRRLVLDTRIAALIPQWQGEDRATVTVRDLLVHAGGLPAHLPLFARAVTAADVLEGAATAPLAYRPRTASVYSDLGFIVLGDALARLLDEDLCEAAERRLALLSADPPRYRVPPGRSVASTGGSAWRGRELHGEVHDDNAAAMGGVAGHAGLFGDIRGVSDVAQALLRSLRGGDHLPFAPAWAVRAAARHSCVPGSSRALAWDTALPTSSSGPFLSRRAIGHTGFTGTSVWIDPELDLWVVLLTNRVAGAATPDLMAGIRGSVHAAVGAAWRGADRTT